MFRDVGATGVTLTLIGDLAGCHARGAGMVRPSESSSLCEVLLFGFGEVGEGWRLDCRGHESCTDS